MAQIAIAVRDAKPSENIDVDDEESLDAEKLLEANSAITAEKEIAADTIGIASANTGPHFLPYVKLTTLELEDLLIHYYESIHKSATESLLQFIRTFYRLSEPQDWGCASQGATP